MDERMGSLQQLKVIRVILHDIGNIGNKIFRIKGKKACLRYSHRHSRISFWSSPYILPVVSLYRRYKFYYDITFYCMQISCIYMYM